MTSLKPRALLLSGLFVLAACGGGPAATQSTQATPGGPAVTAAPGATATAAPAATTPTTGTVDTCKLFTVAELNTATGAEYGAGVDDGYGQCVYRVGGADHNDGKGQLVVAVNVSPFDTIKSAFGAGGVEATVSGKPAFWNPTEGLQSLWVDLGGRVLVLSFDPVDDSTKAVAIKIAELAVANL